MSSPRAGRHGHLHFERVSKRYRSATPGVHSVDAIRDLDLLVEPDSSLGVIGPNGAGKSTMLKLAAGITGPSSGYIERGGRTTSIIELGAGVHPDLTGRENVDLLASLALCRLRRQDLDSIVEFSGLGGDIDSRVKNYSTGMLARLSFAVAVHVEPELLLIDEVLSVGDLEFQQRCRGRIRQMRTKGVTLVLATHDLDLVTELCDRAILLVAGKVERDGDAAAVVRHYQGRPDPSQPEGPLGVRLVESVLMPEGPLRVELRIPELHEPATVHFEYVVEMHPDVKATGQSSALICGTAGIAVSEPGTMGLDLSTEGLPRGRYELNVRLEDRTGRVLSRGRSYFDILGPAGIDSVRIPNRSMLNGAALEPRQVEA